MDGVKICKRICMNFLLQFGGKFCVGVSEEMQFCNVKLCFVNGGFFEWGSFGDCDKICGLGIKRRIRICMNLFLFEGGKNCEGVVDEVEECNK